MIRVRIGPPSSAVPVIVPVAEGAAVPGFTTNPDAAVSVDGRWLVTLGANAEAANALAVVRLGGKRQATFGGVCIKPAAGMEEVGADMAGAAACASAMLAVDRPRSPAPVAAVLALANRLWRSSARPLGAATF